MPISLTPMTFVGCVKLELMPSPPLMRLRIAMVNYVSIPCHRTQCLPG
jgi:hypothetical protein